MEIKYFGANAIKKVFSTVKGWIATAKTEAVTTAKNYADSKIEEKKYTLPVASTTVLGGIKAAGIVTVGSDGTIAVNAYSKGEADAKFQTEAQVTSIAEAKAAAKVAEVTANAPESLDTLKEIADFLTDNDVANGLVKQLATKADKATLESDYQKKADMPTFTEYTDTEIDAIAAEVAAA